MKLAVRITPRARDDLLSIGRYTARQWGRAKRDEYLRQLVARMDWLADNPGLGRPRDDIAEGYRSFLEGRHVIFYTCDDRHLNIIGVLHQAMDTERYFS